MTALCLSEEQAKATSWEQYKTLKKLWVKSPPAQVTLAIWLRSVTRR